MFEKTRRRLRRRPQVKDNSVPKRGQGSSESEDWIAKIRKAEKTRRTSGARRSANRVAIANSQRHTLYSSHRKVDCSREKGLQFSSSSFTLFCSTKEGAMETEPRDQLRKVYIIAYLVCGIPYLMPTPTRGSALITFFTVAWSGNANRIEAVDKKKRQADWYYK